MRCSAVVDHLRCKADAVGVLTFDNGKSVACGGYYEYPLCEGHADPKFHLRPVEHGTYWTWKMLATAAHSGRTEQP